MQLTQVYINFSVSFLSQLKSAFHLHCLQDSLCPFKLSLKCYTELLGIFNALGILKMLGIFNVLSCLTH